MCVYVIQYHYIIIYSHHSPVTVFFLITLDLLNFSVLFKRNLPSESVNTVFEKTKYYLLKSEEDRCLYVFDTGCVTQTRKNVLTFLPLDKHEYSCLREDIDFGLLIAKLSVL